MTDDDAAVRARLAALEAEVKAETEAKSAAKAVALERLRQQKAAKDAERQALVARQAAVVQKSAPKKEAPRPSSADDFDTALALARKARGVKEELTRPRAANEKSWLVSGGLSTVLGPLGWLYAGSFREAVPASAAYLLVATIIAKLPFAFVFWPAIMVAALISGVIGIAYSYQYNKHGKRQRLFGDKDDKKKKLPSG